MRRLEYKDAKSHKFWELDIEGDAYTVRYGKVGTDGQTQTKTCASPAKAEAEGTKKLESKIKKGYAEVAVDTAAAAKRAEAEGPRNPALEAGIFDNPTNDEAWQVYGDWLQEQHDVRGELISLDLQRAQAKGATKKQLEARIAEIEAEHRKAWLGGLAKHLSHEGIDEVASLVWSRGYIVKASVGGTDEDWSGASPDTILRALVKSSAATFLAELSIGTTYDDEDWRGVMDKNVQAITKAGKLEALTRLSIADTGGYWDISSTSVGDVTKVLPVVPRLRRLYVRGGEIELSQLHHDRLESVTLETGGLPQTTVRAVGKCKLPAATNLVVYFGSSDYGAGGTISDLAPLFTGKGVPKLRQLGLCNAEFQDDIARELAKSPLLAQLTRVDLSLGTMTDAGAQHILDAAKQFSHLEALNLSNNFISAEMCAQLTAALPHTAVDRQEEPYEYNGRLSYYVSVGE
ncbi:putative cytoplasmic protein [Enhygromyxa salina]|uniref:Putative cytoplasmic protein n=1 Tax=Enhygromyxa salina TaxID=215803 RepID=A0A0C1ZR12_9BACT|nr:WGR domain-containing protein [Enhygromyxa salina]KIG13433.1 putative cytoplasmic protein [Enhygromyxa salina]